MPPSYPTRYTLAEHEGIQYAVVAARIPDTKTENKIRAHNGVVFDGFKAADAAAEEINDRYAAAGGNVYPDPANGALVTGFTKKVRLDGQRMYVPLRVPAGAV
ncbi:hypothetical protein ACFVGM_09280 [Kitasatospora purpeofusca]|uniref:hypothetical protein n=1 Tax=Kitasatospora purpeofusca TaxID=67352 RepID=UPI0036B74F74